MLGGSESIDPFRIKSSGVQVHLPCHGVPRVRMPPAAGLCLALMQANTIAYCWKEDAAPSHQMLRPGLSESLFTSLYSARQAVILKGSQKRAVVGL